MKKIIFSILLIVGALNTSLAQQYFTYDGDDFNVYLKTNTDNSQVLEIYFTNADKSDWIQFEIVDFHDMEDTEGGGFQYEVKDGVGKIFLLDYFRDEDYIIVSTQDDSQQWELERREE